MSRPRFPLHLALVALLAPSSCEDALVDNDLIVITPCAGADCALSALARAYNTKDTALFASVLANDPASNAEFLFLVDGTDTGETSWGYNEMVRIHQRIFHPESPQPGDTPLPAELWLQSLSVTLVQSEVFTERPDLYSSDGGADGKLDPARWRAADALYAVQIFVDLQGDTDYAASASGNFVVIEDLTKAVDAPGKFLLYIWEDICPQPKLAAPQIVEPICVSRILAMYR